MDKTLYIHIGHYKTGTTALQIFLDRSQKFLQGNGFEYPDIWKHHSKHSSFAFSILRSAGVEKMMYNYSDPTPPSVMWQDLFNHIKRGKQASTLISSEELMRMGQFPKAVRILGNLMENRPANLKIKAIVYLRDPGSHLVSWYNQLIKMSFPVADLNAAVDGDIEAIHFDYKRALAPWIDILGRENVIIRPYVNDRENPEALHRDFMGVLGVDLPEGIAKMPRDPNPRFDDRVVELVRLMQNMDFPRATTNAIRSQVVSYLETQDKLRPGEQSGIRKARKRAKEGLDWLATLPDNPFPVGPHAERLPKQLPQSVLDQNLMLGFVFSELIQLRQRVNKADLSDQSARMSAFEERLAKLEDD